MINIVQTPPVKPAPATADPTADPAATTPAAQGAASPEAAPTPKEPTDAELEQRRKDLVQSLGWDKTKAGREVMSSGTASAPATTVQPPEKKDTPAATEPAAPKATPSTRPKNDSIATKIAKDVAAEISSVTPAATNKPDGIESELTPEDAEEYRVFKTLETMDPKQAGIAEKFRQFALARYQYEANWLAANPGKDFNPEDAEHDEFYQKNQPQVDEKVLEEARDEMKFNERYNRTVKPQLDEVQRKKALEEAAPVIRNLLETQSSRMVKVFDEELGKLFVDGEGNALFTDETLTKLEETDPLARDLIDAAIREAVEPAILELEKTAIPELNYALDGRNELQKKIIDHLHNAERDFREMGNEANDPQGRTFITQAERFKKIQEIESLPQAQKEQRLEQLRKEHWWITLDQLEEIIVDDIARATRKIYDHLKTRTNYARRSKAENPPQPAVAAAASPQPASGKSRPPSISSSSDIVTTQAAPKTDDEKYVENARSVAFPRG